VVFSSAFLAEESPGNASAHAEQCGGANADCEDGSHARDECGGGDSQFEPRTHPQRGADNAANGSADARLFGL
jgi:hypothetical protein